MRFLKKKVALKQDENITGEQSDPNTSMLQPKTEYVEERQAEGGFIIKKEEPSYSNQQQVIRGKHLKQEEGEK